MSVCNVFEYSVSNKKSQLVVNGGKFVQFSYLVILVISLFSIVKLVLFKILSFGRIEVTTTRIGNKTNGLLTCFSSFFFPFSKEACVSSTSPLKTLGKRDVAYIEQFLHFPQIFLPVWRTLCHFH